MQAIIKTVVELVVRSSIGIWLAEISAAGLFGIFEFDLSRWLMERHLPLDRFCAVQAAFVAVVAAIALWLILREVIARRRMIEDEMRRVAELNHSLRNALEVIVLAHYGIDDPEHKALVLECTDRIDQKLRELFPGIGKTRIIMKDGKWEVTGRH